MKSTMEIVEDYLNSSYAIAGRLIDLLGEVDECNLSLSDLDHFLELEDLSPEELVTIQTLRKCILKERRKAKDYVCVINQIVPKQIEGRTTRDRYEYAIRNLDNRVYTPRVVSLEKALTTNK